jgi:hypothetical protein
MLMGTQMMSRCLRSFARCSWKFSFGMSGCASDHDALRGCLAEVSHTVNNAMRVDRGDLVNRVELRGGL